MKCLEKDPGDRFQSPAELIETIQALPFPKAWDQAAAKAWWSLHLSPETILPVLKPLKGSKQYQPVKDVAEARA
jgi:hypothetical protein